MTLEGRSGRAPGREGAADERDGVGLMAASGPGDPRALSCRYCGSQRRFVRRTLVCATCDDTPRWPGGPLDPDREPGREPGRDARRDEEGRSPGQAG